MTEKTAHPLRAVPLEDLLAELNRRVSAPRRRECPRCERPMFSDPKCDDPLHSPRRVTPVIPTLTLVISGPKGCGKSTQGAEIVLLCLRHGYQVEVEKVELETIWSIEHTEDLT